MIATLCCPRGHLSTEPDYCSECGARMSSPAAAAAPPEPQPEHCPACGARREPADALFCEICGYNFETGADAPAPVPEPSQTVAAPALAPTPPSPSAQAGTHGWAAVVSVDPQPHGPGSPEAPPDVPPTRIVLASGSNLIGRRSAARAIFPELDLSYDTAVSHRHALLQLSPEGHLLLRDIGSSNGTLLNGKPVTPLADIPLSPGDVLLLGHWSRIVLEASPGEVHP